MDINETDMERAFRIYFRKTPCKGTIKEKEMFAYAYRCGMRDVYDNMSFKLDKLFKESYDESYKLIRNTWRMVE